MRIRRRRIRRRKEIVLYLPFIHASSIFVFKNSLFCITRIYFQSLLTVFSLGGVKVSHKVIYPRKKKWFLAFVHSY